MLGSIFLKNLRDLRGQILGWGLGMGVLAGSMVLMFPSIQNMGDMDTFVQMLPEAMQKLIGDKASMGVLEHFLDLKLFDSWLPVFFSVFAIIHGAGTIAGEEENGTIDLLMANPVKRWRVVVEKFAAIAAALLAMCVLISIGLTAGVTVSGLDADRWQLTWATFNVVPVSLVFGALATMGSCVLHRQRRAATVAVVCLAASFFLYSLAPLSEALKPWVPLSIFHYYAKTKPIGDGVNGGACVLLLTLVFALVAGAVAAFRHKDLSV